MHRARHKTDLVQLRVVLARIQSELDLFPVLGYGGGGFRIALASYPFVSVGLQQSIVALQTLQLDPRRLPRANMDFVGRPLADNPFRDIEAVVQRQEEDDDIEDVLNDAEMWNPMHLNTVLETAKLVSRLCLTNGVDGTTAVDDSTLLHRVRQMTVHLPVVMNFGKDMRLARERAIQLLSGEDIGLLDRLHRNWDRCDVKRRKGTPLETRYDKIGLTREATVRRTVLWAAAQLDEDYYLPKPSAPVDKIRRKARKYELAEESSMAEPGGLGEVEQDRLFAAMRPPFSNASALPAVMAAGMLSPRHFHTAKVNVLPDFAVIQTRTNSFTALDGFDPRVHQESEEPFVRVVPARLGEALLCARKNLSPKECIKEATKWMQSIVPRATLHRFASALMHQGPLRLGYPSVYPHLGLAGNQPTMQGWRYYVRFDLAANWPRISQYLNRFDEGIDWTLMPPPAFACGSNCVPRDEVVTDMAETLARLLDEDLPATQDELVCKWNATAALAHLLLLGHLFLRNFPLLPPEIGANATDLLFHLELVTQKSPVVVWIAPALRRLLLKVKAKWSAYAAALKKNGVILDSRGNEGRAYGFWSLPSQIWGAATSSYQIPRRFQCTNGLLHWPTTEKFGGLHPNALRHWSSTRMLESGEFLLAEVNWCHGHGSETSWQLSPRRRETDFGLIKQRGFAFLAGLSQLREIF